MAVVVQAVHTDLAAPVADLLEVAFGDFVAFLGYQLERRDELMPRLHLHERRAEVETTGRLNVVREDAAAPVAMGPEPHERDRLRAPRFEMGEPEALDEIVGRCVDRPARKRDPVPTTQRETL
jgi:hypothetical protein